MDQIKIGKFIASKRKEKGLTQSELAEKLMVTDRAVSKWENGNSLPDASNIKELCKILNITINDLFSGEVVDMKENEKVLENNLLELLKEKEKRDKYLLQLEIFIGILIVVMFTISVYIASYVNMPNWARIVIIIAGLIPFITGIIFALKIEQVAGYYECANCHHKYVPQFASILWAPHVNRTRHMKCPKCGKKSWQKKVISK